MKSLLLVSAECELRGVRSLLSQNESTVQTTGQKRSVSATGIFGLFTKKKQQLKSGFSKKKAYNLKKCPSVKVVKRNMPKKVSSKKLLETRFPTLLDTWFGSLNTRWSLAKGFNKTNKKCEKITFPQGTEPQHEARILAYSNHGQ